MNYLRKNSQIQYKCLTDRKNTLNKMNNLSLT